VPTLAHLLDAIADTTFVLGTISFIAVLYVNMRRNRATLSRLDGEVEEILHNGRVSAKLARAQWTAMKAIAQQDLPEPDMTGPMRIVK
jgi:hypothetical protein